MNIHIFNSHPHWSAHCVDTRWHTSSMWRVLLKSVCSIRALIDVDIHTSVYSVWTVPYSCSLWFSEGDSCLKHFMYVHASACVLMRYNLHPCTSVRVHALQCTYMHLLVIPNPSLTVKCTFGQLEITGPIQYNRSSNLLRRYCDVMWVCVCRFRLNRSKSTM